MLGVVLGLRLMDVPPYLLCWTEVIGILSLLPVRVVPRGHPQARLGASTTTTWPWTRTCLPRRLDVYSLVMLDV